MRESRTRVFLVASLAAFAVACTEGASVPTASDAGGAPISQLAAVPRVTGMLSGWAADSFNLAAARRMAEQGDSSVLLALTAPKTWASPSGRARISFLRRPGSANMDEVYESSGDALIYSSDTWPADHGSSVGFYVDFSGESASSQGDYRVTEPNGTTIADWASLGTNSSAAERVHKSFSECRDNPDPSRCMTLMHQAGAY